MVLSQPHVCQYWHLLVKEVYCNLVASTEAFSCVNGIKKQHEFLSQIYSNKMTLTLKKIYILKKYTKLAVCSTD